MRKFEEPGEIKVKIKEERPRKLTKSDEKFLRAGSFIRMPRWPFCGLKKLDQELWLFCLNSSCIFWFYLNRMRKTKTFWTLGRTWRKMILKDTMSRAGTQEALLPDKCPFETPHISSISRAQAKITLDGIKFIFSRVRKLFSPCQSFSLHEWYLCWRQL